MGVGSNPKSKRRNSDKRKEKSRDAARSRRSKESEIFSSLIKEIPLSSGILTQLDKASVIRLAITHLKIRSFFCNVFGNKDVVCTFSSNELESKLNKLYYKAINGFIIVLTNAGSLVYVTENIKQHLGLSQIDMLGQNILDFIHPCDHDEIKDMWSLKIKQSSNSASLNNISKPSSPVLPPVTSIKSVASSNKRLKLTCKDEDKLSASSSLTSSAAAFVDEATFFGNVKKTRKDCYIRMKSVQFNKSRSNSQKSNSFKVIRCSGFLISSNSSSASSSLTPAHPSVPTSPTSTSSSSPPLNFTISSGKLQSTKQITHQPNLLSDTFSYLVLECETILQPTHHLGNSTNNTDCSDHIMLGCHSFITHHTMDMKIVYCDDNIEKLLGYKADELVGTSFYDYHHIYDSSSILNAFKTLFTKGQMVSGLYRFLAHNGGFAWVETQASLVKNPQTDKPQSVICISSVVSDVMSKDVILSFVQLQQSKMQKLKQKIVNIRSPNETALNLIQKESRTGGTLLKIEKKNENNFTAVADKQRIKVQSSNYQTKNNKICNFDENENSFKGKLGISRIDNNNVDSSSSGASNNTDSSCTSPVNYSMDNNIIADDIEVVDVVEDAMVTELDNQIKNDYIDNVDVDAMFATEMFLNSFKNNSHKCESNVNATEHQQLNMFGDDGKKMPSDLSSTLPHITSTASLYKLLNEFEYEDELRAPFIPLDDLVFASEPAISNDTKNKNILAYNDNNLLVIDCDDINRSAKPELFCLDDEDAAAGTGVDKNESKTCFSLNSTKTQTPLIIEDSTAEGASDDSLQITSHSPIHYVKQQHDETGSQKDDSLLQQPTIDINTCFNTTRHLVLSKFKNNTDHRHYNNDIELNGKHEHQQKAINFKRLPNQMQLTLNCQNSHSPLILKEIDISTSQLKYDNTNQIGYLFNRSKISTAGDINNNNIITTTSTNNNVVSNSNGDNSSNFFSGSSVLKNLLLKGVDTNYGYRLKVDNVLRPPSYVEDS